MCHRVRLLMGCLITMVLVSSIVRMAIMRILQGIVCPRVHLLHSLGKIRRLNVGPLVLPVMLMIGYAWLYVLMGTGDMEHNVRHHAPQELPPISQTYVSETVITVHSTKTAYA